MDESKLDDKKVLPAEHSKEFDDKALGARVGAGGSGGLGYPSQPQLETETDTTDETLANDRRGVDVSGVQTGAGSTRMTITPSLSNPDKEKKTNAKQ